MNDDYNNDGYNTGGYNNGGYSTGGYNNGGHNTGGYNNGGYNTGGYGNDGYNTGDYNNDGNQYRNINQDGTGAGGQNQEEKKRVYRSGLIAGIFMGIAIMLILILGSNVLLKRIYRHRQSDSIINDMDEVSDKIELIEEYLDKFYFEEIDEETLVNGIYYGMAASLGDPYTTYYTPDEYEALTSSTNGEYCGIGVVVSKNTDDDTIVISRVFKNSPAREAGLQEGDVFYTVDGQSTEGMSTEDLAAVVVGEKGTEVTIEIMRDDEILEFTITRKKVEMDTVEYEMKDGNIGYVRIEEFDAVTPKQVENAIKELDASGMKGIIVDLRNNPGGSLSAVREIASMFQEGKELFLYSETKEGDRDDYYLTGKVLIEDIPMVIIINENSASASEAFSGAMKCYGRASIVGTVSFGKGIMQTIYALNDGSALKITTGKYYLPDGSNIHKIGITPDYEVEASEEADEDAQLDKAMELLK